MKLFKKKIFSAQILYKMEVACFHMYKYFHQKLREWPEAQQKKKYEIEETAGGIGNGSVLNFRYFKNWK